jgi:hypothetical protein
MKTKEGMAKPLLADDLWAFPQARGTTAVETAEAIPSSTASPNGQGGVYVCPSLRQAA